MWGRKMSSLHTYFEKGQYFATWELNGCCEFQVYSNPQKPILYQG
jgi:hypothetical protein